MKVVWLPKAIANRDALIDYIAEENLTAAIEYDERIEAQTGKLEEHPEIGRPGRKAGTRELVIGKTYFVVVYRIKEKPKRIEVLRVLHSSQAWP